MQFDSFSSQNESSSHSSDYDSNSNFFDDIDKLLPIADSFISEILEDNYTGKALIHFVEYIMPSCYFHALSLMQKFREWLSKLNFIESIYMKVWRFFKKLINNTLNNFFFGNKLLNFIVIEYVSLIVFLLFLTKSKLPILCKIDCTFLLKAMSGHSYKM